eukprot:179286-Chlamydomonas_euryale.AAC.2
MLGPLPVPLTLAGCPLVARPCGSCVRPLQTLHCLAGCCPPVARPCGLCTLMHPPHSTVQSLTPSPISATERQPRFRA